VNAADMTPLFLHLLSGLSDKIEQGELSVQQLLAKPAEPKRAPAVQFSNNRAPSPKSSSPRSSSSFYPPVTTTTQLSSSPNNSSSVPPVSLVPLASTPPAPTGNPERLILEAFGNQVISFLPRCS
jgi:hypothetical protein